MLRIGQQNTNRIISRVAFQPSASLARTALRHISTGHATRPINSTGTPSVTWFIGAGVVFTSVSLLLQSPYLGLSDRILHNDSDAGGPVDDKSNTLGGKLAAYFRKAPPPVDQKDIVLDTDLTVTSWKQLEQTGLVNASGVMLWGSNKNGLIDPTGSSPGVIQIPQRLAAFQGKIFRDLKLGDDIAAAVDEEGNVYQWGSGYNSGSHQPEVTLRNRDIAQVALGDTRLFGLTKDGTRVYVLPKVRPATGPTKAALEYEAPKASVWRYVGLGGNGSADEKNDFMTRLPVREILQKDERITSIASGKNHMLMLTSQGRVIMSEDGLSVSLIGNEEFRESRIVEVACGDSHSLARDDQGRCWTWGVNGFGQLAQGAYSHANLKLVQPTLVKDIAGTAAGSECVKVAAGSHTSYVVIRENSNRFKVKSAGMGQWGQLGDGTFTHIQGSFVKIAPLSDLAEYNETEKKIMPIGIHDLAIGYTHAFAVLDNAIIQDTPGNATVTHGRDVLTWGQNTYFQLLTGKRANKTEPVYALPLNSDLLQPADKAIAAIAKGKGKDMNGDSQQNSETSLSPTNRLQLVTALPRKVDDVVSKNNNKDKGNGSQTGNSSTDGENVEMLELKIVAGNGVSGVYCHSNA
ncbi:hypothetical protein BGZ99_008955 [Dissophora globulifera]|uniref:Uncharacterized protein n=1 Tax=Dissophora globulifera TaxID=979702 RepID=A0A9P6UP43_9FUNG|nr:hypothetical protein BGZ99_008955 [Dissophora globulifera]